MVAQIVKIYHISLANLWGIFKEVILMLVAFFLFCFNGLMPIWVRQYLGAEACCFSLICSVCISFVVLILVHDRLEAYSENREKQIVAERSAMGPFRCVGDDKVMRRASMVNNNSKEQNVLSSNKEFDPLIFLNMFVGTIAAIIFAVAVSDGSITVFEFAKYLAIPTIFLDLIYFAIGIGESHDLLLGIVGAIELAIWGWGFSLVSISVMTIVYVLLFPILFIASLPIIIICFIVIKLFGH